MRSGRCSSRQVRLDGTWERLNDELRELVRQRRRWVGWPADQEPPPMPSGFLLLPRRWVVERTFAWLGRYRRLSKDRDSSSRTA